MIDYKEVKIIMAKIIELFNHKGGVSKITTTFHLAWKLTQKNKKVLVVDGDSQCNLTGIGITLHGKTEYTDDFFTLFTWIPGAVCFICTGHI